MLPTGKGWWMRSQFRRNPRGASAFVDKLVRAGFEWISPIAIWGDGQIARSPELYAAIQRAGLELFPTWGLPRPESWQEDIAPFLDFARSQNARGVIVNPEREFKGHSGADYAAALAAGCSTRGLSLIFSSYSIPSGQPSFPWEDFAAVADMAIPLTFDRDLQFDPRYVPRAINQYAERGFRNIVPAASCYAHRGRRDKTPAELERHLALMPPARASIMWNDGAIDAALWPVLAAWDPANPRDVAELPPLPEYEPPRRRNTSTGGKVLGALAAGALATMAALRRRG